MQLEYTNVWLSWGDGTVEPLRVDGGSAGSDGKIKLVLNGSPTNPGILHTYAYPDTYDIKIYSLPTPDKGEPRHNGPPELRGRRALRGGCAKHGGQDEHLHLLGHRRSCVVSVHRTRDADGARQRSGWRLVHGHLLPGAPADDPELVVRGRRRLPHRLLPEVPRREPPDLTAEGPLHLLKVAVTEFPGLQREPRQGERLRRGVHRKGDPELLWDGVRHLDLDRGWRAHAGDIKKLPPHRRRRRRATSSSPPALPVPLTGKPHGVCVRVKAFTEMGEIGQVMTSGVACGSTPPAPPSAVTLVMRPSAMSFADMGSQVTSGAAVTLSPNPGALQSLAPSGSASGGVNVTAMQDASLPLLAQLQLQQTERDVWSEPAAYEVVPHDPSVPCRLYFEAKGGPFTISDVTEMKQEGDGTFSGKGKLHLALPSGPDGSTAFYVSLAFSHLTLTGAGDGREVTAGTLDSAPTSTASLSGDVTGLTGKLTHVKATAGADNPFTVTLSLGLSGNAWLKPEGSAMSLNATGPSQRTGTFTPTRTPASPSCCQRPPSACRASS